jgi:hypothetical protein
MHQMKLLVSRSQTHPGEHCDNMLLTPKTIFDNPAILRRVLAHLETSPTPTQAVPGVKTAKGNLLCIALTCRDFTDSALDALWKSIDSLVPLLSLLRPFKLTNKTYVRNTSLYLHTTDGLPSGISRTF